MFVLQALFMLKIFNTNWKSGIIPSY